MFHIKSALLLLSLILAGHAAALPKHYHESGGFATKIEAGLGGKVIKVTNTDPTGPGSLRDAINQSGKRLIVFEVGGVFTGINDINTGNVTIAGQTAPYPGVTLIKRTFNIPADSVVVSHIAVRVGDIHSNADAIEIQGSNVVLNHVIATWGVDETLTMMYAENVTLFKCIMSESLSHSIHEEGEHSKGSLIHRLCKNISIIDCLYSHNRMRNPRISDSFVTMVNSVVYAPQPGQDDSEEIWNYFVHAGDNGEEDTIPEINFIGNVGIHGPLTDPTSKYLISGHKSEKGKVFMKDNMLLDTAGNELFIYDSNIIPLDTPSRWPENMGDPMPAHESFYEVLRTAGPQPAMRDTITARIIKQVADGTGTVINSQEDVGGYPTYLQTYRPITVPDGIEARRAWLDSLEDAVAVDRSINLSRYYGRVGLKESDKLINENASVFKPISSGGMIENVKVHATSKQVCTKLTLQTAGIVAISIIDLSGKTVFKQSGRYLREGNHTIITNVSHLQTGLFICRVMVGNRQYYNNFYHY